MRPTFLPRVSRRSLLAAGSAAGLTGLASGLTPTPARATAPASIGSGSGHLVLDYRPSQPTGWPGTPGQSFGTTIGGHTAVKDFIFNGTPYRVGLLPLGQSGDSPDPVYLDLPADPDLAFEQRLADGFGSHYNFRYQGGFRGRGELRVQSYSVFVTESTQDGIAQVGFGGGLYVVYEPDLRRGDPARADNLRWIQVVRVTGGPQEGPSEVDNMGRANPFYVYGGLTSIDGTAVCNFHDVPQAMVGGSIPLDNQFKGEVFLARDTGTKDASGRGVVDILGGLAYGWQVRPTAA
jgi:hypothetical protein